MYLIAYQSFLFGRRSDDHIAVYGRFRRGRFRIDQLWVNSYVVIGATPEQETLVRAQIQVMQPAVYPLRVLFVPHWKYMDTARIFRLHVPAGYTSAMFTHLPSRSVFIDSDRYVSNDSLGHWVAHELGHLAANSASENAADKAAREYRKRLKDARKRAIH